MKSIALAAQKCGCVDGQRAIASQRYLVDVAYIAVFIDQHQIILANSDGIETNVIAGPQRVSPQPII
ncbi:MAG TPA: hypothetical protein VIU34_00725, partial [Steroidobacter sp.]